MDPMRSLNYPTLPIEILDLIIQEVPNGQLPSVLRANSLFRALGVRALYHDIAKMPPPRCVACLASLASNTNNAALVHSLTINWSSNRVIGNLLRLLQSALQHLKSLQHLTIELSPHDSQFPVAWLFSGTSFSLRTLVTSARCDEPMARFLETQPLLEELSLNGFQTNSPFVIARSALPRLTSFRSIHAGMNILEQIVAGRPIEAASITIFPGDEFAPLDTLKLSSTVIQRLIILSLDDMRPLELLYAIVQRFPQLESLHFVMFGGRYDHQILLDFAPALSKFSELRNITFMSGFGTSFGDDHDIVTHWHSSCPTLRTIILPEGKLWVLQDKKWTF